MFLAEYIYKKVFKKEPPYYYKYKLSTIITKPIRKYFTNVVAANCPFNVIRILIYRLCGFKIGKGCFIGMRCYLDDMCYEQMTIKNNCIISYGVFFACHGRNQKRLPIVIEDGVYIGMHANIISKTSDTSANGIVIGKNAVIGACTLVNKSVPENATAVGIPCRIISSDCDKEKEI